MPTMMSEDNEQAKEKTIDSEKMRLKRLNHNERRFLDFITNLTSVIASISGEDGESVVEELRSELI